MLNMRRILTFTGTEVLSPFVLATALFAVVAVATSPLPWLAFAVPTVFIVGIPLAMSLWMTHSGKVTDRFIVERRQRHAFYLASLASVTVGLILVSALPVGYSMRLSVWTIMLILISVAGINYAIKISVHSLVAAFFALSLPYLLGSWLWLLATVPVWALVTWSRVALQKHTVREVALGTAAGIISAGAYISLLPI